MKTAYFDCFAGAGGDMISAALLDAGLDKDFLINQINSLNLPDTSVEIKKVVKSGVTATSFKPVTYEHHHHRGLCLFSLQVRVRAAAPPILHPPPRRNDRHVHSPPSRGLLFRQPPANLRPRLTFGAGNAHSKSRR